MHTKASDKKLPSVPRSLQPWLIAGIWLVLLNAGAVFYILKSKFIYYWDNATYWEIAMNLADRGFSWDSLLQIYRSVGTSDYNEIAGILPAICAALFGKSRLIYILSIVNFYTFPSVLMAHALSRRLCSRPVLSATIALLMCPVTFFAGIAGFVDVGGVCLGLLCYQLYLPGRDQNADRLWKHLLIGLLLVVMILFRRYYAFFGVSFVTAMIGECILLNRKRLPLLVMLAEMAAILLLLFPDFVWNRLLADYGSLYAAYQFGLSTDVKLFARYFGLLLMILLPVVSLVVSLRKKLVQTIFPWVQLLVCFFTFVCTQTHGQQHLLLYIPGITYLLLILFEHLDFKGSFAAFGILSALNFASPFLPRVQPQKLSEIQSYALIPNFSMLPRMRYDTEEVLAVKQYLNETVGIGKKVGVLSSSFTLNDDILRKCEGSLNLTNPREDYLTAIPCVDSRDKDLSPLFTVDYMVVAFPAQTHLGEENQRIIVEGVRCFEENSGFAQAFTPIGPDMEISGIRVRVFKRMRDVTPGEKSEFSSFFN